MSKVTTLSRFTPVTLAKDASLIIGSVLLIAVAAQISVPLWPVPVTLSTLAVMIVAGTLGASRGSLSIISYLTAGAIGLPVFAGAAALSSVRPTFGYLVGFVFAAALIGLLVSRWAGHNVFKLASVFVLATAVIYFFGAGWLVVGFGMTANQAVLAGVLPFLLGDLLKIVVASSFVAGVRRLSAKY